MSSIMRNHLSQRNNTVTLQLLFAGRLVIPLVLFNSSCLEFICCMFTAAVQ